MKRLLSRIENVLTDAALLEEGAGGTVSAESLRAGRETIEDNLIEIAFAEAADYDDIHRAILREHRDGRHKAHSAECRQGDSKLCFV